jgi:Protein of unknown function (DUF2934)
MCAIAQKREGDKSQDPLLRSVARQLRAVKWDTAMKNDPQGADSAQSIINTSRDANRFGVPMSETNQSYELPALQHASALQAKGASAHQEAIAIAAYYLAEKRGFDPQFDLENWLSAKEQVSGQIARHSPLTL